MVTGRKNSQSAVPRRHGINPGDTLFLPSFCDIRLVFAVVMIAELLVFVVQLVDSLGNSWSRLGLTSLFVQWIALSGAAILCLARPMLARISNSAAALISYLLLLLVTAVISELGFRVASMNAAAGIIGTDHASFMFRNLGISAIISALMLRYLYVQHQWKQQIEAEAQARVQALQSRIRPHFLFNSMNSIAALTSTDPARAECAVQDLSELFRDTLREASERITLEQELDVVRRYLRMESLRLDERLSVEWQIDTLPLQRKVPALILQPLLENAVYHGIEPLPDGGVISITGCVEGPRIIITVSNPLPPASAARQREGNQIALENIRLRLKLAFGHKTGVALRENNDQFEATIYFPRENAR